MRQQHSSLTTPLKVGMAAFGIAVAGVALGFFAWYVVGSRLLAQCAFLVTVVGVGLGFVAIVVGQVLYARQAITGSVEAMKDLKQKFKESSPQRA
jgi:hypothetical protein